MEVREGERRGGEGKGGYRKEIREGIKEGREKQEEGKGRGWPQLQLLDAAVRRGGGRVQKLVVPIPLLSPSLPLPSLPLPLEVGPLPFL